MDPTGVVLQADLFNLGLPMLLLLSGVALVVMEAFAPGAHFMVVGVALLVSGLLGVLFASLGLGGAALPLALGITVLITGAITFTLYRELDLYGGESQGQTSDSDALKGEVGRVTERVTDADGEVKIENGGFNPYYQARSFDGDIEVGTEVIVVDPGGGNVLTVMSAEEDFEDEIDRELARETAEEDADVETETERSAGS